MARILITGSTDGIGRGAAEALLREGHEVVVHGRSGERLQAVDDLLKRGAGGVTGDLAQAAGIRALADQANSLGGLDAVIHNAGVIDGPALLPVNVVASYLLTALIQRPARLIYLSSSMHRGGRADLVGADWAGGRSTRSYSDSKLFVTTLVAAIAERWPPTLVHAVDPGWVPTKMGGPSAPDSLELGHVTQAWLATSEDAAVQRSGGYWHHQRTQEPHPSVHDRTFQAELLDALAEHTGIELPTP